MMPKPISLFTSIILFYLANAGLLASVVINEIHTTVNGRVLRTTSSGAQTLGSGITWWDAAYIPMGWQDADLPIGVFTAGLETDIGDEVTGKTHAFYTRKNFTVSSAQAASNEDLLMAIRYKDGFIAYLNGVEVARQNMGPVNGFVYADQASLNAGPATPTEEILNLGTASGLLVTGDNVLAIQVNNHALIGEILLDCQLTIGGDTQALSNNFLNANGALKTHTNTGGTSNDSTTGTPVVNGWLDLSPNASSDSSWTDLEIITRSSTTGGVNGSGAIEFELSSPDPLQEARIFSPTFDLAGSWTAGTVASTDLDNTHIQFSANLPEGFEISVDVESADGTSVLTGFPTLERGTTASTIGYWRFDDAVASAGTSIATVSNTANPGTLTATKSGNPIYSSSVPGGTVYDPITNTSVSNQFSMDAGANNARVEIPNDAALNTEDFTLEFFVKITEEPDGHETIAIRSSGAGDEFNSTVDEWLIGFDHGGASRFGRIRSRWSTPGNPPSDWDRTIRGEHIYVDTDANDGNPASYDSSDPSDEGDDENDIPVWHHVALTYDSSEQSLRIFTDGVAGESAILQGPFTHPNSTIEIGNHGDANELLIDEVRYTGRILTTPEFLTVTPPVSQWQTYHIRLGQASPASQATFLNHLNTNTATDFRLAFKLTSLSYDASGKQFAIDDFAISYNDAGYPTSLIDDLAVWKYLPGLIEPTGGVFDPAILSDPMASIKHSEWIELHNSSGTSVDLTNWTLTDNPNAITKWTFPAGTTIPGNGYLLILADNETTLTNPAYLHTSFRMNAAGEYLGLYDDTSTVQSEMMPEYPRQYPYYSYGNPAGTSGPYAFLEYPTPGQANQGAPFVDHVDAPDFDIKGGFFDAPVTVTLTSLTGGATIRYTTDGTEPTLTNGTTYTAPLTLSQIDSKTGHVIRARAFMTNWIPSNTKTNTYLVQQDTRLRSAPALIYSADLSKQLYSPYGILAIQGGQYVDDKWEPVATSDYNMPFHRGRPYERPVHLEFYFTDGSSGFRTQGGLRVAASNSARPQLILDQLTNSPWTVSPQQKPSFNIYFRDDYGNPSVTLPFNGVNYPVDEFDHFRVRAGKNDISNPFLIDEWVRRLYREMGNVSSTGVINTLYVNGEFKGMYNMVERLREPFFDEHHDTPGGVDWDVLQAGNENSLADGDLVAWNEMLVRLNAAVTSSNWDAVLEYADVVNMADYFLINVYMAMWDWPSNNWVAARERSVNGRYRFYVWDAEGAINRAGSKDRDHKTIENSLNGGNTNVPQVWNGLMRWPEFRLLFADRIQKHLFNGGVLDDRSFASSRLKSVYDSLEADVSPLLDYLNGSSVDRDDLNDWVASSNGRRTYLFGPNRTDFSDHELWPSTAPPTFSPLGGSHPSAITLTLSHTAPAGSTVYYTTDGTDPRIYGGGVSGSASSYSSGIAINNFYTKVKARVRNISTNEWSALTEAEFFVGTEPPSASNLAIEEFMYHPLDANASESAVSTDKDDFEYVQLMNTGSAPVDLTGCRFINGIEFDFTTSSVTVLQPGERLLIVKSLAAFQARYGTALDSLIGGEYGGRLSNGGEQMTLVDATDQVIHNFIYDDKAPWPEAPDGSGPALELVAPATQLDHNLAANWQAGGVNLGTPGGNLYNANLVSLALSDGALTPPFTSDVLDYAADIMYATTALTVTPTASQSGATLEARLDAGAWVAVTSGNASAPFPMTDLAHTLEVRATSSNGLVSKVYSVALSRLPSTNATLANLSTSAGAYTPAFDPATFAYALNVPHTFASATVTPIVADTTASVETRINGEAYQPATSGSAGPFLALNVGNNLVDVRVTAQDGTTIKTYTLTINRAPGDNANLASMVPSVGSILPSFDPATLAYSASVLFANSSITVTPTGEDSNASIRVRVNGSPYHAVVSGNASNPLSLNPGTNTIDVEVTAQNGLVVKVYTIDMTRLPPSSNADLADLTPSSGSLSPIFDPTTVTYSANVLFANATVTVTPTVANATAIVRARVNGGTYSTVASGSASSPLALNEGANTIDIEVTAEDTSTVKVYSVSMTRLAPSMIANLANLELSAGTLAPTFDSATTSYTASVLFADASITTTPTLADETASILVRVNGGSFVSVASGTPSDSLSLNLGANLIDVQVTAEDGTTVKTYTTTVTRQPPSANADLASLALSEGTLAPVFAVETTIYTADIGNLPGTLTVTPTVADSTATVDVRVNEGSYAAVTSGSPSNSLALNVGTNTIDVRITAEDGSTSKTYTTTVTRAASDNADLASLALSESTLSPVFAPETMTYTAQVGNLINTMVVTPSVAEASATIQVRVNGLTYATVPSGTDSNALALNVGTNPIDVQVTAQDGTTIKTYTITVTRAPSNNADLASLVPSSGTLEPTFNPDIINYATSVDNATSTLSITPTAADSSAMIDVRANSESFTTISSGTSSSPLALNVGENPIELKVTAQDGSTVKTYTLTVTRAPSSNADLDSILLSEGVLAPTFAPETLSYSTHLGNDITAITVTPTTTDATASIEVRVNGEAHATVDSGQASGSLTLNVGTNSIEIRVTAEDGITIKTYTVTADRAPSNNADLTSLALSEGSLAPVFASATTTYAANVGNLPGTLTVTPTVADSTATIDLRLNGGTYTPVTSGSASDPLTLTVGANTVDVRITAEDGSTTKTYTTTVTRALSDNADLTNLALSEGTLNPAFAAETAAYTALVSNLISTMTITPTVAEANATLEVRVNGGAYTSVASGTESLALALNVGANPIDVKVTAQDGTSFKTYTTTVTRAPSNHANLASLTPSAGTLEPVFASATIAYTASVDNATASLTMTPVVAEANALIDVRVNGGTFSTVNSGSASTPLSLAVGTNTVDVRVTAQDGTTVKTYTLIVTRAPSSNANLDALGLSNGVLAPVFAPGTLAYTTSLGNGVTSITTTPSTEDSTASIEVQVNGETYAMVISGQASAPLTLNVGMNVINIRVTAEDGTTTKTYTVTADRAPSVNADLAGLALSEGTLAPVFAAATTTYTATIGNLPGTLTVTPTIADSTATVDIRVNDGSYAAVTSGSVSDPLALTVGANTVDVRVTAEDGTTTKTYTTTITRAPSNNADLTSLALSAGLLSPAFQSGTLTYSVSTSEEDLDFTPSSHPEATIDWRLDTGSFAAIDSGASASLTLSVGSQALDVRVTAQDGVTTKTYTIDIERLPSDNANLVGLTLDNVPLSPVFDKETLSYDAEIAHAVSSTTLTATTENLSSTLEYRVNGSSYSSLTTALPTSAIPIDHGATTITVRVTALDGQTQRVYTVALDRAIRVDTLVDEDDGPDEGFISLRDAIEMDGRQIEFAPVLDGQTIELDGKHLIIEKDVTIDASMLPNGITLSANRQSRVLQIRRPNVVSIERVSFTQGGIDGTGAGILNSGSLTLIDSLIYDNHGGSGRGGGIYSNGNLSLERVTVWKNTSGEGGGVYKTDSGASANLINCTITENRADRGGGVVHRNGTMSLNHVTITDNEATGSDGGGGIYATADLNLENTIVARNTAEDSADIRGASGTLTSTSANLIGSNESVETEFPTGTLVGTPAGPKAPGTAIVYDNGGLTPTIALAFDSPARDAAASTATSPTADQRGTARPFGTAPDLGAFEATAATGGYGLWIAEHLPSGSDFSISGDSDGDGLSNLKEYSLNTAPDRHDPDPDEGEIVVEEGSGNSHLLIRFPHRTDVGDLVIEVRAAGDLRSLKDGGNHTVPYRFINLSRVLEGGFISIDDSVDPPIFEVIDTEPLEQHDRRFLQMHPSLR